jgi:hypothetical protein
LVERADHSHDQERHQGGTRRESDTCLGREAGIINMKSWRLKRTVQCAKCPWRKDVNPHDIPNGYTEEKHRALKNTIARPDMILRPTPNMACHETDEAHCLGWLINQLGPGNNIPLRISMISCTNAAKIRLRGEQHDTFEDTLP